MSARGGGVQAHTAGADAGGASRPHPSPATGRSCGGAAGPSHEGAPVTLPFGRDRVVADEHGPGIVRLARRPRDLGIDLGTPAPAAGGGAAAALA